MRKTFMAAGAAALTLGVAAVAYAQNPPPAPTLDVGLTPTKAGTKSKPANAKLKLTVVNNVESKTTMSQLVVFLPKTVKTSTSGLPSCNSADLAANGPSACPSGSKAGPGGTAHAVLVANNAPINFKVTPYVGKGDLLFYLQQQGGNVTAVLHGKLSRASGKFGSKMTIRIPDGTKMEGNTVEPNLQQPVPGIYSALKDLSATLTLKKGKKYLISTVGCKSGKQPFKATLTYAPNPLPPAKPTATATDSTNCKK